MKKFRAGRPLPMVLLLIPFLYLMYSNPFGEPAQTIVEVIYLCVILGITLLVASRNTDEVEVAAARFSASAPGRHRLRAGCDGSNAYDVYLRDHRLCGMVLAVNAVKWAVSVTYPK